MDLLISGRYESVPTGSRPILLTEPAAAFLDSAEFRGAFSAPTSLSDATYVDLLYENTLGRVADAEGRASWISQLKDEGFGRDRILFAFATSVENRETLEFVEPLKETAPRRWNLPG